MKNLWRIAAVCSLLGGLTYPYPSDFIAFGCMILTIGLAPWGTMPWEGDDGEL